MKATEIHIVKATCILVSHQNAYLEVKGCNVCHLPSNGSRKKIEGLGEKEREREENEKVNVVNDNWRIWVNGSSL